MTERRTSLAFAVALLAALAAAVRAEAPRVLQTAPRHGQEDVSPQTRAIRVTFDQPMSHDGHSVVGGGETFPEVVGPPRWVGDRVFVLPVRLKPGRLYRLSINSESYTNFRSRAGEAATPCRIAFRTADDAGGEKPLTPEQNREAVADLRAAIDADYSCRDRRQVDWAARFEQFAPAMEAADTPREFAAAAVDLLSAAEDPHLWLKVDGEILATWARPATPNIDGRRLARLVPGFAPAPGHAAGRFDDGIVYLLIPSLGEDLRAALPQVEATIAQADPKAGLILDLRPNGGGDERLGQAIASRFVDRPAVYSRNRIRRAGQWHGPYDRTLTPAPPESRFVGRVAVLMGPANMSSCESLLLMLRQSPRAVLIGQRSRGSSGNPRPLELSNGVVVMLPSWEDLQPDGAPLEGVGIDPDIEAVFDPAGEADAPLEAALKHLRARSAPVPEQQR